MSVMRPVQVVTLKEGTCVRNWYLCADTPDKLLFTPAAAPPTVFLLGVGVGSAPGGRMVFWLVRMGWVEEEGAAGLA